MSAVYDLPFGRNRPVGRSISPVLNAFVGGWTFSGIATLQSGRPLIVSRPAVREARSAKLDDPSIERWFDSIKFYW